MYLLYLRFDDQGQVITMHVQCSRVSTMQQILDLAKQRGFTPASQLVEYASFHANLTIYPRHVPNFHFYKDSDFIKQWERGAST